MYMSKTAFESGFEGRSTYKLYFNIFTVLNLVTILGRGSSCSETLFILSHITPMAQVAAFLRNAP